MSGLIAALSGAQGAADTTGGFYQNAANEIVNQTGSPAAQTFVGEQDASLRPRFQEQDDQLTGQLAGQGIASSGAGRAAFGNLAANQAATLAGAAAPLYQQAEQQYGQIIGAMPGAQNAAYQGSIQDLYQAIQSGAMAAGGMPSFGGGGGLNLSGTDMSGLASGAYGSGAGGYTGGGGYTPTPLPGAGYYDPSGSPSG